MYVHTDGRTFKTGFIESILSKSRPKNWSRDTDDAPLGAVCHP